MESQQQSAQGLLNLNLATSAKSDSNQKLSIVERLQTGKALDWKLLLPELETLESRYSPLERVQEVLDYVSPTKSPIRESREEELVSLRVSEEYEFVQTSNLLGEGISKVKLAKHVKTGGLVAIKVFEKSKLLQQHTYLIREIMVLGGLYHPHINPILQVVDSPEHVYMVIMLEKGGDLFNYIEKKGKLPEIETVALFRQILSAIHFLHSQGIIHRDIKPENILLDETHSKVKLCDFGFSAVCHPAKQFEDFCGSPEYAAPEMIGRKPYLGPEVDIWSLGVTLFAMLTGCLPFPEQNRSKLYMSIMTAKFTIPPFVSESASSLIRSIIVPQVSKRCGLSDIFSHPFISSNPSPIFINNIINSIPLINPSMKTSMLELGIPLQEIEEYQKTGHIGPVKAAFYLLEENYVPRGVGRESKQDESLKRPRLHTTPSQDQLAMAQSATKYIKTNRGAGYTKIQSIGSDKTPSLEATSPLSQIKLSINDTGVSWIESRRDNNNLDMLVDNADYADDSGNAVRLHHLSLASVTFQHQSTRQQLHSFLLKKILGKAGRISEIAEHDENTMIFEMIMARKSSSTNTSLFTWTSENDTAAASDALMMDVDQEILACFQEPAESMVIRVSISTLPLENDPLNWCSIFKLLGSQRPGASEEEKAEWVLDQFDDFCLDLMNDDFS